MRGVRRGRQAGEAVQLLGYRVRRGVSRRLGAVGAAAAAPKPCGRSLGRANGRRSGLAVRYPAVKKPTKKQLTATKAA